MAQAAASNDILATGRRKTAVARVRVRPGDGKIIVNGRPLDTFFHNVQQRNAVFAPLDCTGNRDKVDVVVRVDGGGIAGQAGAVRLGIARALKKWNEEIMPALRDAGHLTRDSRMKERKKYGLRGARRGVQFSKR